MQVRKASTAPSLRSSVQIEGLENRVLFSTVNPASFGATPNDGKDDRAAIQAALNAAKDGDTITFAPGQYDINGTLNIPSNRTLNGAANQASKLVFTTGNNQDGMILNGSSNVTIDGLAIQANDGVILATNKITNIHLTNNDFVWGYNGTYYNRLVLHEIGSSDGLVIEHNNFHDSQASDRNIDLWDASNTSYSYNTFYKIHDGGHIDGTTTNFKFVGNVGQQIQRMGLELQDHSTSSTGGNNILISNNVFTNWYKPDNWSFGLSIVPSYAHNVTISNNYISALNQVGGWGNSSQQKFGIAIEAGLQSGIISGNVVAGNWLAGVCASVKNTQLKDNAYYGKPMWQPWAPEQGNWGDGSISDLGNNRWITDASQLPPPPTPTDSSGGTSGTGSGGTTGTGGTGGSGTTDGTGGTGPVAGNGKPAFLSDLPWVSATNGLGPVERDMSNGGAAAGDGTKLSIAGHTYTKGLGVALNSSITYNLAGQYTAFYSEFGIDAETASKGKGSMDFQVWADGVKIYDTGVLTNKSPLVWKTLNITGVKTLMLRTTTADTDNSGDHGDWGALQIW